MQFALDNLKSDAAQPLLCKAQHYAASVKIREELQSFNPVKTLQHQSMDVNFYEKWGSDVLHHLIENRFFIEARRAF